TPSGEVNQGVRKSRFFPHGAFCGGFENIKVQYRQDERKYLVDKLQNQRAAHNEDEQLGRFRPFSICRLAVFGRRRRRRLSPATVGVTLPGIPARLRRYFRTAGV